MKIYTKSGDEGQTSLFGGLRVSKDDLRVQAYGELDELNSFISIALHYIKIEQIKIILAHIQHLLFSIGSDLATPISEKKLRESIHFDCGEQTKKLESEIDYWQTQLSPLKSFIIPGGSMGASFLHLSRTICRRAERAIVQLSKNEEINNSIIPFINRLSDLFFVLARAENHSLNIKDIEWDQKIK